MYLRLTKSKKSKHPTLQIVQGVREGKKVKQKIIASLGVIKDRKDLERLGKLAEHLIQRLEKEGVSTGLVRIQDLSHKKTIYDGFGTVVDRLMQITGFTDVLKKAQGKREFDLEEVIKLIITQRLELPSSKLRTYERQQDHGFNEINLQHIYRSMDVIASLESDLQKQAFDTVRKFSDLPVDCFFFDVTTLYFESVRQDELRAFGYSKDQKHHQVQIVFALVVDNQGMPLAYEVFQGNLAETRTLIPVLKNLRERFSINNVTVVCDRGLASKPNVAALQEAKFQFVIASKLRSISKKLQINDLSTYAPLSNQQMFPEEEQVLVRTMEHPQYENTLLISTFSPKRAQKDKEDRERLLDKLRKKLSDSADETSVKKVISNSGYKKYTNVQEGSLVMINEQAIEEDAAWDGFHGIAVSNSANLTVEQALGRYRDLWHVEETFRIAKCTLRTRPIFHWKPQRIRAHVLLCFLTLFLERFLELRLKQEETPLTPDRIRYALAGVHTMHFENKHTNSHGEMSSSLTKDALNIFKAVGLSADRETLIGSGCCV